MRAVQGALIVASSIQIILGFSQMWAICSRYLYFFHLKLKSHSLRTPSISLIINQMITFVLHFRFFSPLGMAPVIALVGFGLFDRGFPVVCCIKNYCHFLVNTLITPYWAKLKCTHCYFTQYYFLIDSLYLYQVGRCVEIGIPMLILFIAFSQVLLPFLF